MPYEDLPEQIIGAAIEGHRHHGPGLLESTYRATLAHEFNLCHISFQKEIEQPERYKSVQLADVKYRVDFIFDGKVIVEAKGVLEMHSMFQVQTLTCMKHTGIDVGLLINMDVEKLADSVDRLITTVE